MGNSDLKGQRCSIVDRGRSIFFCLEALPEVKEKDKFLFYFYFTNSMFFHSDYSKCSVWTFPISEILLKFYTCGIAQPSAPFSLAMSQIFIWGKKRKISSRLHGGINLWESTNFNFLKRKSMFKSGLIIA